MADFISYENVATPKPSHSVVASAAPVLAGIVTAMLVLAAGGVAFGFALGGLLGRL